MQIIRDINYLTNLDVILDYIARDSFHKASVFLSKLDNMINNIVNFPYKYRKSFCYDDEDIRDLVFKGYTIPYLIDTKNDQIIILDIFKWINK